MSDSVTVSLLFLLLLKKLYTFHSLSKCVIISEHARVCVEARDRERLDEERGHTVCTHAGVCVFLYCVCDRELPLILLVVIGVSVGPHTLGCGCNCPWQTGPVTMWRLREEEWG